MTRTLAAFVVGVPAFTWRPSDWLSGEIIDILERT